MSKPLVMVVDDEIDLTNSIAKIIRETARYDAITAYSAREALEHLKKNKVMMGLGGNRVRMILLDIKMPEMDGLTLLEKIRRDYGEDIGIAILTAWEDEEKWDRATAGFIINYIKKPFKSAELLATIDGFFAGEENILVLNTFEKHIAKREEFQRQKEQPTA
ncbi:response regulator [Candidatus Saganbacteria bacterium]|nr:response regulator [Candidatus Saganbacteria bacterium]